MMIGPEPVSYTHLDVYKRQSFRIMKSDLDARPVFLQKENSIKGHFLICYLAVLLERIFQFKIFHTIKPLDEDIIVESAKKTGKVITVEE